MREALEKASERARKIEVFLRHHAKPDGSDAAACSKYAQAVYAIEVVRAYLGHLEGKDG